MSTDTETRLERLTVALLQSDYVKSAFLDAIEVAGMARLIELAMETVIPMDAEQVSTLLHNLKMR